MGEWSEYFEDFPEENQANWVNGQFDPKRAAELRAQEANELLASAKTSEETRTFKAKIAQIIEDGNARAKAKK